MLADDQRSKEQRMAGLKLDIFPHIFPKPFFDRMQAMAERNPALQRVAASELERRWLRFLFDRGHRLPSDPLKTWATSSCASALTPTGKA